MYILAIETTGAFASVALTDGQGKVLSKVQGKDRFSHLQNLTPQIKQVMDEIGLSSIDDITAIAVSQGPGSFTGIRIGISTGRALAQIKDKVCVPVPTLEALALRAEPLVTRVMINDGIASIVCPILDARRSQIYGGAYLLEDGFPVELIKGGAYTLEEFMELLEKEVERLGAVALFLGDGVDAYGEKVAELLEPAVFAKEDLRYQDSETVGRLAAHLLEQGKGCAYDELKPEYMRLAEAERKLKAQSK